MNRFVKCLKGACRSRKRYFSDTGFQGEQEHSVTRKGGLTRHPRFVLAFSVQVRELDTFAGGMAAKKKACLDQINKDRQELVYIDGKINSEARK